MTSALPQEVGDAAEDPYGLGGKPSFSKIKIEMNVPQGQSQVQDHWPPLHM